MKKPDILIALDPLIKVFRTLGISYYIGGSVASSAYGIARATLERKVQMNVKSQMTKGLAKWDPGLLAVQPVCSCIHNL